MLVLGIYPQILLSKCWPTGNLNMIFFAFRMMSLNHYWKGYSGYMYRQDYITSSWTDKYLHYLFADIWVLKLYNFESDLLVIFH